MLTACERDSLYNRFGSELPGNALRDVHGRPDGPHVVAHGILEHGASKMHEKREKL